MLYLRKGVVCLLAFILFTTQSFPAWALAPESGLPLPYLEKPGTLTTDFQQAYAARDNDDPLPEHKMSERWLREICYGDTELIEMLKILPDPAFIMGDSQICLFPQIISLLGALEGVSASEVRERSIIHELAEIELRGTFFFRLRDFIDEKAMLTVWRIYGFTEYTKDPVKFTGHLIAEWIDDALYPDSGSHLVPEVREIVNDALEKLIAVVTKMQDQQYAVRVFDDIFTEENIQRNDDGTVIINPERIAVVRKNLLEDKYAKEAREMSVFPGQQERLLENARKRALTVLLSKKEYTKAARVLAGWQEDKGLDTVLVELWDIFTDLQAEAALADFLSALQEITGEQALPEQIVAWLKVSALTVLDCVPGETNEDMYRRLDAQAKNIEMEYARNNRSSYEHLLDHLEMITDKNLLDLLPEDMKRLARYIRGLYVIGVLGPAGQAAVKTANLMEEELAREKPDIQLLRRYTAGLLNLDIVREGLLRLVDRQQELDLENPAGRDRKWLVALVAQEVRMRMEELAEEFYQLGLQALDQGDYVFGIRCLNKALDYTPFNKADYTDVMGEYTSFPQPEDFPDYAPLRNYRYADIRQEWDSAVKKFISKVGIDQVVVANLDHNLKIPYSRLLGGDYIAGYSFLTLATVWQRLHNIIFNEENSLALRHQAASWTAQLMNAEIFKGKSLRQLDQGGMDILPEWHELIKRRQFHEIEIDLRLFFAQTRSFSLGEELAHMYEQITSDIYEEIYQQELLAEALAEQGRFSVGIAHQPQTVSDYREDFKFTVEAITQGIYFEVPARIEFAIGGILDIGIMAMHYPDEFYMINTPGLMRTGEEEKRTDGFGKNIKAMLEVIDTAPGEEGFIIQSVDRGIEGELIRTEADLSKKTDAYLYKQALIGCGIIPESLLSGEPEHDIVRQIVEKLVGPGKAIRLRSQVCYIPQQSGFAISNLVCGVVACLMAAACGQVEPRIDPDTGQYYFGHDTAALIENNIQNTMRRIASPAGTQDNTPIFQQAPVENGFASGYRVIRAQEAELVPGFQGKIVPRVHYLQMDQEAKADIEQGSFHVRVGLSEAGDWSLKTAISRHLLGESLEAVRQSRRLAWENTWLLRLGATEQIAHAGRLDLVCRQGITPPAYNMIVGQVCEEMMRRYREQGLYGYNAVGARMTGTVIFYCDKTKKGLFRHKFLKLLDYYIRDVYGEPVKQYEGRTAYDWESTSKGASWRYFSAGERLQLAAEFDRRFHLQREKRTETVFRQMHPGNPEAERRVFGQSPATREFARQGKFDNRTLRQQYGKDLENRFTQINGSINWKLRDRLIARMKVNVDLIKSIFDENQTTVVDMDNLIRLIMEGELNLYCEFSREEFWQIIRIMRTPERQLTAEQKRARISVVMRSKEAALEQLQGRLDREYASLTKDTVTVPEIDTEHYRQAGARGAALLRLGLVTYVILVGGRGSRFGAVEVKNAVPKLTLKGQYISFMDVWLQQFAALGRYNYDPRVIASVSGTAAQAVIAVLDRHRELVDKLGIRVGLQRSTPAVKPTEQEINEHYASQQELPPLEEAQRQKEKERQQGTHPTVAGEEISLVSSSEAERQEYESVGFYQDTESPLGSAEAYIDLFLTRAVSPGEETVTVTGLTLPEFRTVAGLQRNGYILRPEFELELMAMAVQQRTTERNKKRTAEEISQLIRGRRVVDFLEDFGVYFNVEMIEEILKKKISGQEKEIELKRYIFNLLGDCGVAEEQIDEIILEIDEQEGIFTCDLENIIMAYEIDPEHDRARRQADIYRLTGVPSHRLDTEQSLRAEGYILAEEDLALVPAAERERGLPEAKVLYLIKGRKAAALLRECGLELGQEVIEQILAWGQQGEKIKLTIADKIEEVVEVYLRQAGLDPAFLNIKVNLRRQDGGYSCRVEEDIDLEFNCQPAICIPNGSNMTAFNEVTLGRVAEVFAANPEMVSLVGILPALSSSPGGVAMHDRELNQLGAYEGREVLGEEEFLLDKKYFTTGTVYINPRQCWRVFGFQSAEDFLRSTEQERIGLIDQTRLEDVPLVVAIKKQQEVTPSGDYEMLRIQMETPITVLFTRNPHLRGRVKFIECERLGVQGEFSDPKTLLGMGDCLGRAVEAELKIPFHTPLPVEDKDVPAPTQAEARRRVELAELTAGSKDSELYLRVKEIIERDSSNVAGACKQALPLVEDVYQQLFKKRIDKFNLPREDLISYLEKISELLTVLELLLEHDPIDESGRRDSLLYMKKEAEALSERITQSILRREKIEVNWQLLPQSVFAVPDKDRTMTEAGQPYSEWQADKIARHLLAGMDMRILTGAVTADIIRTGFEPILRALMRMDIPAVARWTAVQRLCAYPEDGGTVVNVRLKPEEQRRRILQRYDQLISPLYETEQEIMAWIGEVESGQVISLRQMRQNIDALKTMFYRADIHLMDEELRRLDSIQTRTDYRQALLLCRYHLRIKIEELELAEDYQLGIYDPLPCVYFDSRRAGTEANPQRPIEPFSQTERYLMWNIVIKAYLVSLFETEPVKNIFADDPQLIKELQEQIERNLEIRSGDILHFSAVVGGIIVTLDEILERMLKNYERARPDDKWEFYLNKFQELREKARPALQLVRMKDSQNNFFSISCDELTVAAEFRNDLDRWHKALIGNEKFFKIRITEIIKERVAEQRGDGTLRKRKFGVDMFERAGNGYINITLNNKSSLISMLKHDFYTRGGVILTIGDSKSDVGDIEEQTDNVLNLAVFLSDPWRRYLSQSEWLTFKKAGVLQYIYVGQYDQVTGETMERGQLAFYPSIDALMEVAGENEPLTGPEDLRQAVLAESNKMPNGYRAVTPFAGRILELAVEPLTADPETVRPLRIPDHRQQESATSSAV